MSFWTKITLPDRPSIGGAAELGSVPRFWSTFTTLIPDPIADWIAVVSCGPKIGCTIRASYCFEAAAVCSSASCFFGSLAASKTVTVAPCAFATALAAASIGAS